MPAAELKLVNHRAINRRLERIPESMRKKALKKALRSASRPIINDARGRVPVESGMLRRSLGVKVAQGRRRRSTAYAVIGPRTKFRAKKLEQQVAGTRFAGRRPSLYAHLVEFGTSAHRIPGVPIRLGGKTVRVLKQVASTVHPGAQPKPFLRPAFRNKRMQALRQIASTLRRFMASEARR